LVQFKSAPSHQDKLIGPARDINWPRKLKLQTEKASEIIYDDLSLFMKDIYDSSPFYEKCSKIFGYLSFNFNI